MGDTVTKACDVHRKKETGQGPKIIIFARGQAASYYKYRRRGKNHSERGKDIHGKMRPQPRVLGSNEEGRHSHKHKRGGFYLHPKHKRRGAIDHRTPRAGDFFIVHRRKKTTQPRGGEPSYVERENTTHNVKSAPPKGGGRRPPQKRKMQRQARQHACRCCC